MNKAAENLEFEEAIRIRDRIRDSQGEGRGITLHRYPGLWTLQPDAAAIETGNYQGFVLVSPLNSY